MIGTDVVVPLDEIIGIREEKTFKHRTVVGGQRFLIIRTSDGEMGIVVHDIAGWLAAIEQAVPHPLSAH